MKQPRPDYGIDAPGIMRGLLATGLALVTLGAVPLTFGIMMSAYAWRGKPRTRDLLIDTLDLRGDERVLDVGTGRGLLAIAAARRLSTGSVVGIDIWNADDLTGNTIENARANADIARVSDRVDFLTGDARRLPFEDASFDAVVSLLCIHNIEPAEDRERACREIARVLRPGGRVVVADYLPTHGYARTFAAAGLEVVSTRSAFGTALSLMWVTIVRRRPT